MEWSLLPNDNCHICCYSFTSRNKLTDRLHINVSEDIMDYKTIN